MGRLGTYLHVSGYAVAFGLFSEGEPLAALVVAAVTFVLFGLLLGRGD